MAEVATSTPDDVGIFKDALPQTAAPAPISEAYPNLGIFAPTVPDAPPPDNSDLGIFSDALTAPEGTQASQSELDGQSGPVDVGPFADALPKDSDQSQQALNETPDAAPYGLREDGTPKGEGFFGPLPRPDGDVSTELSIGVNIDGKETLIPSIVPTLTPDEVQTLLSAPKGQLPPPEITKKAAAFAKQRIANGQSPFAQPGEQQPIAPDPALEQWLNDSGITDPKERALFTQPQNPRRAQGERPPFAMELAKGLDAISEIATGKKVAGQKGSFTDLVESGTYEPGPNEMSFQNIIPARVPQQEGKLAQTGAGLANTGIGFASFLLSPGGGALMTSLGMMPKMLQLLTGLGFTSQQVYAFFQAKTLQEKIETGVGAALLGLGIAHETKVARNEKKAGQTVLPETAKSKNESEAVNAVEAYLKANREKPPIQEEPNVQESSATPEVQGVSQPGENVSGDTGQVGVGDTGNGVAESVAPEVAPEETAPTSEPAPEQVATPTLEKPKPVKSVTNDEDHLRSDIYPRDDGKFMVTLVDVDSGHRLETGFIAPTMESAEAKAREIAGLPAEPSKPLTPFQEAVKRAKEKKTPVEKEPTADELHAMEMEAQDEAIRAYQEEQGRTSDEILELVIKHGGLPGPGHPERMARKREAKRKGASLTADELDDVHIAAKEAVKDGRMTVKDFRRLFRPGGTKPLDYLRGLAEEAGFPFELSDEMLTALRDRINSGKPLYGDKVRTDATGEEAGDVFGFGPGAAAEGEFDSMGRKPQRIANADIDAERAARGAEPLMAAARKSNPMLWDEAMARLDRQPQAGTILVDNITDGKIKTTTDVEQAMLLHEELRLRNEKAMEAERAVDPNSSEELRADARASYDALEARIDRTERAARTTGTIAGRALQARQLAVFDDYTYAGLETRNRNAKGRPLTAEESLKIKKQADEIAQLRKELAEAQSDNGRDQAMEVLANITRDVFKESKKQAKAGKGIVDILHAQRDAAKARIIERRGRLNAGFDPTSLIDEAIIGASHIADGLKNIKDWSNAMMKDFGERIKPYLADLFNRSQEIHDAHAKLAGGKKKATAIDKIAKAVADGEPLTNRMVFELAREHVRNGVEGLDDVIKAVHADLEPNYPGITEREVRDAFTDYGKKTYPSKEEDLVKLREYRRLGQLQSAIEDAFTAEGPKRTGMQRDQPSQAIRDKMKELKDAMRKAGFETKSPDQLASANKARETALTNQIADLEREITTGERRATAAKVADSPVVARLREKAKALREKRDAIRDAHPDVIAAKELKQLETRQRQIQKQIDDLKAKEFAPPGTKKPPMMDRPAHPALEPLLQERDALRAKLKEARKKTQEQKDEARMQKRLEQLNDSINEKLAKLSVGDKSTKQPRVNRPFTENEQALHEELDRVNKMVADARRAPLRDPDQVQLERYKSSLDRRLADVQRRLRENDYSKRTRRATVLDQEAVNKQAALNAATMKLDREIERERLKNRTPWEKFQDAAVKWARTAKLASPRVFPKLIEAGALRIVTNPISRVLSQPLRVIPGLADRAPAQMKMSARAEARRVASTLSSGPEAFRKLIGKSKLDDLTKKKLIDNEMGNLVGNAHGAIKEPVRQGEYHAAIEYYTEQAKAEGKDIREPAIQAEIISSAVADANHAIFMGDNPFSKYFVNQVVSSLSKGTFTGAKTLSNALQFVMPIVKVSSNIAIHTARLNPAIGLTESFVRIATALKRGELANGAEKLSREDAQAISRSFSAGVLGTILAAYAWQNPNKFGGVYSEEAPKNKELKVNEIEIAGHVLPGWLNHAPELQWLNVVASARRVYDKYYAKGVGTPNAITEALAFSMMAPVKNMPFIDSWLRLFAGRASAGQTFGAIVRDATIPGGQSVLSMFDKQQRSPQTFLQEIEMGIPGLRGTVPTSAEIKARGHSRSKKIPFGGE